MLYTLGIFFSADDKLGSSMYQLNFKPPITTAAEDNFEFIFFFFFCLLGKTSPDISCELSAKQAIHM